MSNKPLHIQDDVGDKIKVSLAVILGQSTSWRVAVIAALSAVTPSH
jgi:hypothetical protein